MGRNWADALCEKCGEVFKWLIGNPLTCKKCLLKEAEEKKGEQKND